MTSQTKILCVDDEPSVLSALRRLFMDDDYTVLTAPSADEGLEIQARENAQIIISDYRMPVMNGVEFLREVNKRWPDTVRIVLSGYADAASIVSAVNEGQIYKFIPKPWNDDDLKLVIANAVERHELLRQNRELAEQLKLKNAELEVLLAERTANLEARSQMLVSFQNIIDAMPVGVLGIDSEFTLIQCNEAWLRAFRSDVTLLGENIADFMPDIVLDLLKKLGQTGHAAVHAEVNGITCRVIGSRMEAQSGQEGYILVFVRDDNLI
ncbi:MAG TPA: response regulator [Dissulfurispiraceae bacterium]|nr:response regulator [Dissulfurispiraceae bacterium]